MADVSASLAHEPVGLLYLDNDGGWGGSARSLGYLLESLDRTKFAPVVVSRKAGPIAERCERLDIPFHQIGAIPTFRPADRKNFIAYGLYLSRRIRWGRHRSKLDRIVRGNRIKIIHVNHESLALSGMALANRHGLPWVQHLRTQLRPGYFSRWLCRRINRGAAALVCIAEPVRDHVADLVGLGLNNKKVHVVNNTAPRISGIDPLPELLEPPNRFRVLSLANFSPNRGIDRVVDVAAELKARGETGFAFYLCGRPANRHALTGRVAPYYDTVIERVRMLGLQGMVFFPGHTSEPERALAACDCLIKLTRQSNPWGRDIMEALAAGIPVITIGVFQGFVEDGVNGFVDETFDVAQIADHLCALAGDPERRMAIATENRAKARRMFDGSARARDIEAIYEQILD